MSSSWAARTNLSRVAIGEPILDPKLDKLELNSIQYRLPIRYSSREFPEDRDVSPSMRSRAQLWRMSCLRPHFSPRRGNIRGCQTSTIPLHDKAVTVTMRGRICFNRQEVNLSQLFAGQTVGIKQIQDRIWLVSFMDYDLGYFDDETCR